VRWGRAYPARLRIATGLLGAMFLAAATVAVAVASTATDVAFPGYIRRADIGKLKSE
jgi:hypothetical protein